MLDRALSLFYFIFSLAFTVVYTMYWQEINKRVCATYLQVKFLVLPGVRCRWEGGYLRDGPDRTGDWEPRETKVIGRKDYERLSRAYPNELKPV